MATMEEELGNLRIADEEDELVLGQEDEDDNEDEFNLCLVGKVLTNSAVHFPSMRSILAELWHPIEGVSIFEIKDKRVLFCLYNELDVTGVIASMLWFFSWHLILFHRSQKGEDPLRVPLIRVIFWALIHDLLISSMSANMTSQLGNFTSEFNKNLSFMGMENRLMHIFSTKNYHYSVFYVVV